MNKAQKKTARDALHPLEVVVRQFLVLIAFGAIVAIPMSIFTDATLTTMSGNEACAVVDANGDGGLNAEMTGPAIDDEFATKRTRATAETAEVCNTKASRGLHAVAVIGALSQFVLLLAVLLPLHRLIRTAQRKGLFTHPVARRARTLGWVVIAGSLGTETLRQLCNIAVLRSVKTALKPSYADFAAHFDMPYTLLIVGVGLISLGRVFARAVDLQEDQDATI